MAKAKQMLANGPRWSPHAANVGAVRRWAPGSVTRLGDMSTSAKGETAQMFGIAILSALSIAGLHSAVCPSYFTMKTFASQPEAKVRAMEGLWISLGLSTVASGALYFVFKTWTPAIVAELTALALFGIGVWAVNSKPPETILPIEKQPEAQPVPQPVPKAPQKSTYEM